MDIAVVFLVVFLASLSGWLLWEESHRDGF